MLVTLSDSLCKPTGCLQTGISDTELQKRSISSNSIFVRHISDVTDIRAEEMIHETQKLSLSFKVFHKFELSVARGFV